ncbi:hypothetical protein J3Q64DRAFT_1822204 [Phycomyces blakesleeanus]|uniref:Uncharacterized protein n=2 Tax=Phycomyces blakesleeanus TaxID=4837 RepID=A0A162UCQ9_PHYB8|nr:hypothetical protein PHYBLDRAFT_77540 [Phycomyces blakesleeanus NRRL 1555(-)]OAD74143.1 hypothetical protein PHYBLDRAFT_77540 [Phycomyces blakesleeanus NRRL 1555(-)]|eukprot:XP_018292183.1 hypothetical protein PHYBLDRAFT_77540 [Phycomyces blakesleeanus NRRL 1555(-)]
MTMMAVQSNFQDTIMPGAALLPTVGESQSYYFYQKLSLSQSPTTSKYESQKQIVPPVPRDHPRAPLNSPLSPIRTQKRPDESGVSSPADHPFAGSDLTNAEYHHHYEQQQQQDQHLSVQPVNRRERKVSFNEQVVVVCTVIQTDEDDESEDDDEEDYYYHDPNDDFTDHYHEEYPRHNDYNDTDDTDINTNNNTNININNHNYNHNQGHQSYQGYQGHQGYQGYQTEQVNNHNSHPLPPPLPPHPHTHYNQNQNQTQTQNHQNHNQGFVGGSESDDEEAASYRKKVQPVIPPISANNPIINNYSREISTCGYQPMAGGFPQSDHEGSAGKKKFGIKMTMLVKRIGRHLKQQPGHHSSHDQPK